MVAVRAERSCAVRECVRRTAGSFQRASRQFVLRTNERRTFDDKSMNGTAPDLCKPGNRSEFPHLNGFESRPYLLREFGHTENGFDLDNKGGMAHPMC
jgi:hypothetical protein